MERNALVKKTTLEMENFVSKVKSYFMLSAGGSSLTSMCTFLLINILLCIEKVSTLDTNTAVGVQEGGGGRGEGGGGGLSEECRNNLVQNRATQVLLAHLYPGPIDTPPLRS